MEVQVNYIKLKFSEIKAFWVGTEVVRMNNE
jgi:hypothetical protein